MIKILVGMPCYGGINPKVVQNLIDFDLDGQKDDIHIHFSFPQSSIISASRNLIMRDAFKRDVDWVLMWDSDIEIHDRKFFLKMVNGAEKTDATIVGLPCRLKSQNKIYNCAEKVGEKYENAVFYNEDEDKLVDVIGTGVMLINMSWIKENWKKGPWFRIIDTETGFFPEDWTFCEDVRAIGGRVMMMGIKTTHWGMFPYQS